MATPGSAPRQVRFGEFALDLNTGELRHNDRKLTLQDQPFQVLAVLIEHAGQLVTRDELKQRLWPSDTFGDFDHGLNKAVNRLREVLGDSAENPRFIETLPRKGYRLIAPVQKVPVDGASSEAAAPPSNLSGKKVSHYRVLDLLGGGSMGVVYKAEDTKLGRLVALKFLPEELGGDPVALERLQREARAASALNHPNICTIYAIEEHEGHSFLVMELLEGETLRELISEAQITAESVSSRKGPVPLDKLLDTAIQVTNGLAAAHQKAIIHRDIKPANVLLTRQGQVKILDFGLAKLQGSEVPEQPSNGDKQKQQWNPNLALTRTGETIGTVGYMSPEQIRGEQLDFRTDLFSFGMVLYEMATGQRAFAGDTAPVLRDAILNEAPTPVRKLNPELPTRMESIINRALEKNRQARYQSAGEICADLEELAHEILPRRRQQSIGPVNDERARAGAKRQMIGPYSLRITAMVAAFAGTVGVGAVALWYRSPISSPQIVGSRQLTNDGVVKVGGMVTDGARIYFGETLDGHNVLMQVSAAGGEPAIIKTSAPDPVIQAISPDQSQLLVTAGGDYFRPEGGDLWLVSVPAGIGRRMGEIVGRAGGWEPTPKGRFYFSTGQDIYVSDHDGSNPRKVATAPGIVDDLACSADGSKLRFTVFDLGKDTWSSWEVRSDGHAMHPLLPGWNGPPREGFGRWTPDGRYYVFQSLQDNVNHIWALPERSALFGGTSNRPMQVTSGPLSFSVPVSSKDGKQLFVIGQHDRVEIVAYDKKSGGFLPFLGGISALEVEFSRDGKWMTYVTLGALLWRSKSDGSEAMQLTFPPMRVFSPHWSPDGQRIAFSAFAPGKAFKLWLVSRDGGTPQRLSESDDQIANVEPTWSPDGNTLAFGTYIVGRRDQSSIKLLNLKTHQSLKLPGSEGIYFPRWSPNGRYLVGVPSDAKELALFDFSVQKWRRLIGHAGMIGYASWSPDSAYVYFDDFYTDDPAYFRVRIANSKMDRIASLKGMRRGSSLIEPPWSGLAPGGIPLFVRDLSSQEIYALDWQLP
jgi:serine/threonine protein kinase/Tol biopolymer transport system component